MIEKVYEQHGKRGGYYLVTYLLCFISGFLFNIIGKLAHNNYFQSTLVVLKGFTW